MQRYFIKSEQLNNECIFITGQDYHHIKNVMRMKINTKVEICDQENNLYIANLQNITNKEIILNILEKLDYKVELPTNIIIGLGLTRSSKQEEVLKRITELGATAFIPIEMKRSVVRIKDEQSFKSDRMNLIVKEAAEQSKRTKLLKVYEPIKLEKLLLDLKDFDICCYAYENLKDNSKNNFKNIIPSFYNKNVLILIGPEGGFSIEEVGLLNSKGFIAIGLGPRILRLETAPLYIMSAISYELEL